MTFEQIAMYNFLAEREAYHRQEIQATLIAQAFIPLFNQIFGGGT